MSTERELDNETKIVAYMGWGISAQEQLDGFRKERRELKAENAKLRELLDFALPIAMYAASTEEGDRMRELMQEVEL